jgi:hypothetical protein
MPAFSISFRLFMLGTITYNPAPRQPFEAAWSLISSKKET